MVRLNGERLRRWGSKARQVGHWVKERAGYHWEWTVKPAARANYGRTKREYEEYKPKAVSAARKAAELTRAGYKAYKVHKKTRKPAKRKRGRPRGRARDRKGRFK